MAAAEKILRLELSPEEDEGLRAMAARSHLTPDEFVRRLIAKVAEHAGADDPVVGQAEAIAAVLVLALMEERDVTRLSAAEFAEVLSQLENPPPPNDALRRLMSTPSALER